MKSLDPWQKEAFDALIAGENVIVDAPTTAGKRQELLRRILRNL